MIHLSNRSVVSVGGADARKFLQGLVTNNVEKVTPTNAVYAAMLTPQGKYLFDFIMHEHEGAILLDVESARAGELVKKLSMYKLRSAVEIKLTDLAVYHDAEKGVKDPRHIKLGRRLITSSQAPRNDDFESYQRLCNQIGLPNLVPEQSYIMKEGFEALNGVDFNKGCYVGQEVTARMKYRAKL